MISVSAKNASAEQLTERKDRIDYLVNITKIELDNNKNYPQIRQELDNKMIIFWALHPSTRKNYHDTIIIKLKVQYGIILKQDNQQKIKPKKEAFAHAMYTLEKEHKGEPVKESLIIEKLIESGSFDIAQAHDYLHNMHKYGRVLEPTLGFFKLIN